MKRNDLEKNELDEKDLYVVRWIKEMADLEPPSSLLPAIMKAIQPKRAPWWRRLYLWAQRPKTIHLTPIKLAPAVALPVALVLFILFWVEQVKSPQVDRSHGQSIPVVFRLNLPGVRSVSVIGSFNSWNPRGYEMQWDDKLQRWSLTVWLPEGRYEYLFLVDGARMMPDPEAFIQQKDGFGNENSVLILGKKNGQAI